MKIFKTYLFFILSLNYSLIASTYQMIGYVNIENKDKNIEQKYYGGYLGYDFLADLGSFSIGLGIDDIVFSIKSNNVYPHTSTIHNNGFLIKSGYNFSKNGFPLIIKGGIGLNNTIVDGETYSGKQYEGSLEFPFGNHFSIGAKYKYNDLNYENQKIKMDNIIYYMSFGNF